MVLCARRHFDRIGKEPPFDFIVTELTFDLPTVSNPWIDAPHGSSNKVMRGTRVHDDL